MVKFKNENQKHLGILLIFTPIPLDAQEVWSLNQLCVCSRENQRESLSHILSISFIILKILYVFLYITDYLIELAFWTFPIGF